MLTLKERFYDDDSFCIGAEVVSTRGSMFEKKAQKTEAFARELAQSSSFDWVSITDNAGGNPMLGPAALGKAVLESGKEVIIHLSCKDFNRHGLESEAWLLASEGFHNILTLSGDYPVSVEHGMAKPVFDIDSIGLLAMLKRMNEGLEVAAPALKAKSKKLFPTKFFSGAVTTNFKLHENEVMPQYLKLEKKIECGAEFIISQIGYDARKIHEQQLYMKWRNIDHIPLIGNVYVLNPFVAKLFREQKIPGVVVSQELFDLSQRFSSSPDRGKSYFRELAAKQIAIFRGMGGYKGAYLGGLHSASELQAILDIEKSFSKDDWKQFAKQLSYSRRNEFFLFEKDQETGLSQEGVLETGYKASLGKRRANKNVTLNYRLSKKVHDLAFLPNQGFGKIGKKLIEGSSDRKQGPALLRWLEHVSKEVLFKCKDCGDCSLAETNFLCPESQCAKNQRNGPCGGTRDGKCEVHDFECIWSRGYDRSKYEGREMELLAHAPAVQDQALRGTSSWANSWLEKDHIAKSKKERLERSGQVEEPVALKNELQESVGNQK